MFFLRPALINLDRYASIYGRRFGPEVCAAEFDLKNNGQLAQVFDKAPN